jgi:CRP-like cAMP-binding protein
MVAHLDDGTQAEVGLVGFEGMIGLPLVLGVDTAFTDTYMQASGSGLQMEATAFQRELEDNPALHRLLLRYSEAMHAQAMQTAACNGRHNLEQRLARWLLMAHDRTEGDVLPLTQEFLSLMLCVYRPSITTVARVLQRAGIISAYENSGKGNITILDREALEDTACDCYKVVQERFNALLG